MKKFKTSSRYRHKNCIDVDIQVLDVHAEDSTITIMKILWLNRHWQKGNFVIDSDIIKVKSSDYCNWSKL